MIDPKPGDEGRLVVYARLNRHSTTELGHVSSWNDHYVFVRYTTGSTAAATLRKDLEWLEDVPKGTNYQNRTIEKVCWVIT